MLKKLLFVTSIVLTSGESLAAGEVFDGLGDLDLSSTRLSGRVLTVADLRPLEKAGLRIRRPEEAPPAFRDLKDITPHGMLAAGDTPTPRPAADPAEVDPHAPVPGLSSPNPFPCAWRESKFTLSDEEASRLLEDAAGSEIPAPHITEDDLMDIGITPVALPGGSHDDSYAKDHHDKAESAATEDSPIPPPANRLLLPPPKTSTFMSGRMSKGNIPHTVTYGWPKTPINSDSYAILQKVIRSIANPTRTSVLKEFRLRLKAQRKRESYKACEKAVNAAIPRVKKKY